MVNLDKSSRKMNLSIKALELAEEKKRLNNMVQQILAPLWAISLVQRLKIKIKKANRCPLRQRSSSKQKKELEEGFLFALLLVFLVLVTLIIINSFLELERRSPHIARIKIDGPISNDINFNRLIYDLGENPNVKALIVHINSPGGSVVGADLCSLPYLKLVRKAFCVCAR